MNNQSSAIELERKFSDDFDDIYKWYLNPDKHKISEVQEKQLARWKFAREWYSTFNVSNDMQVVKALKSEFNISERQAYTDVRNCKRFFISIDTVNDEFDKVIHLERINKLRNKAIASGSLKGLEVATRCDSLITKIKAYDREKTQLPTPKIVQIVINSDPATVGALPIPNLDSEIKKFWKKKEEKERQEIEDIEHEDIIDNPRNERRHQRN